MAAQRTKRPDYIDVQSAAFAFDNHPSKHLRKYTETYSDLWKLYKSNLTFVEIGERLGITKQAAKQTYSLWFEQFLGKRKRASNGSHQEVDLKLELLRAQRDPTYCLLKEAAEQASIKLEPVIDYTGSRFAKGQCPVYRTGIGTRHVRLHRRTTKFCPGKTTKQQYASFQVSCSMMKGIYAYILFVDIPGLPQEAFVVRCSVIRKVMNGSGGDSWTLYIPIGGYDPKRQRRSLDLRKLKDAWWVLKL